MLPDPWRRVPLGPLLSEREGCVEGGVHEVVVVLPATRQVEVFRRGSDGFEPSDVSDVLNLSCALVAAQLSW